MDRPVPATEITALLGRGTRFEGKLYFEGRLRIDGELIGEVVTDGVLIIGDGAVVDARIEAGAVIIRGGDVRADVRAAQSIELYVPARVAGQLHAPEVFMDKGVQFSGRCTIAPLDDTAPAEVPDPLQPLGRGDRRAERDGDDEEPRSLRSAGSFPGGSVRPPPTQPLSVRNPSEAPARRGLLEE